LKGGCNTATPTDDGDDDDERNKKVLSLSLSLSLLSSRWQYCVEEKIQLNFCESEIIDKVLIMSSFSHPHTSTQ
jgi:hypothetical protein